MKKLFLLLSFFFLISNFTSFSYSMEDDSASMQIDSGDNSGQKRKQPDAEEVQSNSEEKESKRRRTNDQINDQTEEMDLEENKESKISGELNALHETYEKTAHGLAQEGLNRLPAELLLIIFEIDFNQLLKQEIYYSQVLGPKKDVVLDNVKAKCLLKQAIDDINKYCSINQDFRCVVLGNIENKYMPQLLEKFGLKFFEIARMPELVRAYFEKMLKSKNPNLIFTNFYYRKLPGLSFGIRHIPQQNKFEVTYSARNDAQDTPVDDERVNPAAGAGRHGFLIKICDDLKIFVSTFQSHGFFSYNFLHILPQLEKLFMKEGTCLTPLMWAAFTGRENIVQLLSGKCDLNVVCNPHKMYKDKYKVHSGAPNKSRYQNVNVLSLAKTKKIMEMLIKAGAEKQVKCLEIFIKHADFDSIKYYFEEIISQADRVRMLPEALVFSAKMGKFKLIEFFLSLGQKDILPIVLQNAIFQAAKHNHIEIVRILLAYYKSNVDENINAKNVVVQIGGEILSTLYPVYYTSNIKIEALTAACANGNYEMVKYLLENNWPKDVNKHNSSGHTPLLRAVRGMNHFRNKSQSHEYEKIIRLLIEYGADPSFSAEEDKELHDSVNIFPINETHDPKIMFLLFVQTLKKEFKLSDEEIDKIINQEKNQKNN